MCGVTQVQPIESDEASRQLGRRVAVGAVVTIEPRRRKFHRPITLTMPQPRSNDVATTANTNTPNLRLLCSLAGIDMSVWSRLRFCYICRMMCAYPISCASYMLEVMFIVAFYADCAYDVLLHFLYAFCCIHRWLLVAEGGTSPAQWEDITGTTPLTFADDTVSFTTTVSARYDRLQSDCYSLSELWKLYRLPLFVSI